MYGLIKEFRMSWFICAKPATQFGNLSKRGGGVLFVMLVVMCFLVGCKIDICYLSFRGRSSRWEVGVSERVISGFRRQNERILIILAQEWLEGIWAAAADMIDGGAMRCDAMRYAGIRFDLNCFVFRRREGNEWIGRMDWMEESGWVEGSKRMI